MADMQTIFITIFLFSLYFGCYGIFRKDIFSTKTAYKWVFDTNQEIEENAWMKTKFDKSQCSAVNAQVFFRHGARYPGIKDIKKMSKLHSKLLLSVTNQEVLSVLKRWENQFPEESEKLLVDEGEDEHYLLGQRYGTRLKDLFGGHVENAKFISSSKERCKDSAAAFYEGLTEEVLEEAQDNLVPVINDKILRFHESCKKYIHAVETNKSFNSEFKYFKTSPEMLQVAENVKQRMGIQHADIDAGELKLINFLCTFEIIILGQDDWCQFLNDTDREVLEYHSDMKQYWRKAYGHEIMGKMACPLVQHIFNNLDVAVRTQLNNMKRRGDVATFYFGHVETLAPLYASLGLFNDSSPLKADSFSKLKDRTFKSTHILPFSANLAIVLYKCSETEKSNEPDLVLRMFVNEKPVKIPACNEYHCLYKIVRESYKAHTDMCDYHSVCKLVHDEL